MDNTRIFRLLRSEIEKRLGSENYSYKETSSESGEKLSMTHNNKNSTPRKHSLGLGG